MRRFVLLIALGVAMLGLPRGASADYDLTLQFTGLRLSYDGLEITDANDVAGGVADPSEATPLASITILRDGVSVATLTSDISADVDLFGAAIPLAGGSVTFDQGSIFDILTGASNPASGLRLDFSLGSGFAITYDAATGTLNGQATATGLVSQDLPLGIAILGDQPITVTFSVSLLSSTDDGTSLTGFQALGSGTVNARAVPEPSALVLCGIAAVAGLGYAGARRNSA